MAEYQMQELTLPNEEGKKVLFPRMKIWGQVDLNYLAEHINYASTFTPNDIIGLVRSLTQAIAREMGQGHSVKIDGLGVFTLSLGLRDGFSTIYVPMVRHKTSNLFYQNIDSFAP